MNISRSLLGLISQFTFFFANKTHAPAPLLTISHLRNNERDSDNLIVLLPGIQDSHSSFEEYNFIEEARKQNIDADFLLVDAHVGYYAQQTLLNRLQHDIFEPMKERGYKNIWIGGISLGGLGTALYSSQRESDLAGSLLIAPYLGDRALIRAIQKAGGPDQAMKLTQFDPYLGHLWHWLSLYFKDPHRNPTLVLGYGDNDRFEYAHSFLSEILPSSQIIRLSGKHDWESWVKIWKIFLERLKSYQK